MSFMTFKSTSVSTPAKVSSNQPQNNNSQAPSTGQTRPVPQIQIPHPDQINIIDPNWRPPTPQSQPRPLQTFPQFPASPLYNSASRGLNAQRARQLIPTPALLTSPGVTSGPVALTCYDELALIRYCVDYQGYYRSGYRTKFWAAARKGLGAGVGKDVEDVEKRMYVLSERRRREKRYWTRAVY
ncbi:MAG: hypothetical protein M1830_000581 [Pleopsidium flavum]|nr:MAG: hypothetical protein M1830_000581 [Pleopsidium flavum]